MDNPNIPILQIKDLKISFAQNGHYQEMVHSLSFDLWKGKTVGMVGESGSGKSITALSLLGLLGPQAQVKGEILWEGRDLVNLQEKEFQKIRGSRISMIFQEPMTSLNPVYTCGNQVEEVIKIHRKLKNKEAREETIRLFQEVELPRPESLVHSYPHQLSGGQRQRVMIAMALASGPELLIADEPTTALDVTVQKTILDLLIRIREKRKMSMIFISHDLGLIHQIADEVLVLYKGILVEKGNTKDIFQSPQHPYTRGLLACRAQDNLGLSRLPIMSDFMELGTKGEILAIPNSIEEIRNRFRSDPQIMENRRNLIYGQESILRVENLSKSFKSVQAVKAVSFEVFPGETLGLVGESGCGKSTLGRSLLRLIEPDSGKIFFKGQDLMELSPRSLREYRKKIQFIFQDPYSSLNPRQSIGEILMEPLKIFRLGNSENERKKMAFELLHKVQLLPEHFYRYPHEFSGGQRQRIGIARALALSPEFIICDESVSALDVSVQAQIINLLIRLRNELGLTLIFISHDLSVIRFISDRIIVMNQGKFEEVGSPDQIYNHPQSPYTRKLLEAIPGAQFPFHLN